MKAKKNYISTFLNGAKSDEQLRDKLTEAFQMEVEAYSEINAFYDLNPESNYEDLILSNEKLSNSKLLIDGLWELGCYGTSIIKERLISRIFQTISYKKLTMDDQDNLRFEICSGELERKQFIENKKQEIHYMLKNLSPNVSRFIYELFTMKLNQDELEGIEQMINQYHRDNQEFHDFYRLFLSDLTLQNNIIYNFIESSYRPATIDFIKPEIKDEFVNGMVQAYRLIDLEELINNNYEPIKWDNGILITNSAGWIKRKSVNNKIQAPPLCSQNQQLSSMQSALILFLKEEPVTAKLYGNKIYQNYLKIVEQQFWKYPIENKRSKNTWIGNFKKIIPLLEGLPKEVAENALTKIKENR